MKLGTIMHTTHNGYIIVKLTIEKLPKLHIPVYTEDARRIGTLLDIIGPVKAPYAVIKPDTKNLFIEPGVTVYYRAPKPRVAARKRGRAARRPGRLPQHEKSAKRGKRRRGVRGGKSRNNRSR